MNNNIKPEAKITVPELPFARRPKIRRNGYYSIPTPRESWFTDEYVKHAFKETEEK